MAVLQSSGITRALVNAGSSSIAALGSPPNRMGWPVSLGLADDGPALTLRNSSISTSRQSDQDNGEIVDPQTGLRASNRSSISVLAPSATVSDALSTTVLMLSVAEAKQVLSRFEGATAFWLSGDGRVQASYPESARTSGSR
jgi:thiamine biosynthesis lipoprotein